MKNCTRYIVLAATLPTAAFGQTDTITVTATKRTQALDEIPASITVLSGDAADKVNSLNSAEEITQLLTGVQAAVANGTQVAFQIRGIGAVDHQALTPTAAAVYADGVFLSTNVQTGALLYDIDRVEILKGPQGSLYGRNASSGAINFVSRRPGEDTPDYVSLSYGRFDRVDAQAGMGAMIADGVYGRIAGRYLRQDPVLNNVAADLSNPRGPDHAGGVRDEFGVRGALLIDRGGDTTLLARLHYEEDNGVNPAPRNSSLSLGKHEISVGPDGVQDTDNEFFGGSLEAATPLGPWRITSISSIEGYNQQYGFDFDGTQAPFGDATLNANLAYDREFLQLSEEIRLDRNWGDHHSMIGVMASREDFDQEYLIWCGDLDTVTLLGSCRYVGAPGRAGPNPASPGTPTTLITDIEQERITAALFTYHDLALSDRLTLTLGARYTFERIHGAGAGRHIFDDGVVALNNRGGVGPAIGENTIHENRLSGNAALRYAISDAASLYVSFANGYKSGGFNGEVQNNATHFQDEGLFSAETVNAFEAGYKGRLSPALSVSAAAFYQDYQKPQARIFVNFPLPDGTSIISNSLSNLDEAISYGVEADATWRPASPLTLRAALTLLETEIQQTSDGAGNAALFDGNPLPFASKVSAALFGRYDIPIDAGKTLSMSANAKYRSAYALDAENLAERRQDGFTTVDAELSLLVDTQEMEISLWARNLLNKDYATSGFGFIGYNKFIGEPRTFGVRARKNF